MAIVLKGMRGGKLRAHPGDDRFGGCPGPGGRPGPLVDKHSTGGVGDKISLDPGTPGDRMRTARAHDERPFPRTTPAGTLDKLESIPGYRTDLTVTVPDGAGDRGLCHDRPERVGRSR